MSKRLSSPRGLSATPPQQVRIIAGRWKGRMLPVVQQEHVRPTPNRVRETLFNWLQSYIQGSFCLDLFAGSGVLGIESVSRGAAHATIIDQDPAVIALLQKQVALLEASEINLLCMNGVSFLANQESKFDIVYLDPPFGKIDLEQLMSDLATSNALKPAALIYLESPLDKLPQELPSTWQWRRQAKASQVAYGLIATA